MNRDNQIFLYRVKNRELINLKTNISYDLTNLESKLLLALNIDELVRTEFLVKALYGFYDKYSLRSFYLVKHRFIKKTNINIKKIINCGLILKDKVIII